MTKILTTTLVGLLITSLFLSSSGWAIDPTVPDTKTPIKHVIVIFQENISYDHYFGVYPNAPGFTAKSGTPTSDNYVAHPGLLTASGNPNLFPAFLLSSSVTCDMDHDYLPEQEAYDGGLADKFVQFTSDSGPGCNPNGSSVMGYYDGQNATAQWNIAQNFAMSDRSFDTEFGPSTPGAVDLISGQTFGASEDAVGGGAVISDDDPLYDDCHSATETWLSMSGKNIGDVLNEKGMTWGWFQGGFAPSTPYSPGHPAVCNTKTPTIITGSQTAYSAHHEPFEYYNSTANPHHLPPTSLAEIGHTDQANHQYDISDFWAAISGAGGSQLPQVSFIKAPKGDDGHASYSDPIDEGHFLANLTNTIENSPYWSNTAVFVLWDDSDGWYDHVYPPIVNHSNDPVNDYAPTCGTHDPNAHDLGLGDASDRCGYGARLPFLAISPYAKSDYISHNVIDQTSPLKFIEDNWQLGGIPDTFGQRSYDTIAGSVDDLFDFTHGGNTPKVCLSVGDAYPHGGAGLTAGDVGTVVPPVDGLCPTTNSYN